MLRTLSPSDMDLQVRVQLCCKLSHQAAHPVPLAVSVLHTPQPQSLGVQVGLQLFASPCASPCASCFRPQLRSVRTCDSGHVTGASQPEPCWPPSGRWSHQKQPGAQKSCASMVIV